MTDQFGMVVHTPAEPPNGQYEAHDRGYTGQQLYALYPNGYGASIIIGPYSYGGPTGKYELGVLHGGDKIGEGELCYATPITADVLGWLSPEDVTATLHQIAKLPVNPDCGHLHQDKWDPFDPNENEADINQVVESLMGMTLRGDQ